MTKAELLKLLKIENQNPINDLPVPHGKNNDPLFCFLKIQVGTARGPNQNMVYR